jgi:hypothetical protein
MKNPNLTERYLFTNEMDINLDVLCTAMLDRVRGHVNGTDIVTKDNSRSTERAMKLLKKLTKPATLSHSMCHGTILGFGIGTRHRGLAFGGPGHEVVAEVDTVS